jgi:CDP-diacylglycerol--glycerol-3-phosphate 3-phosphatidyltransferase
MTTSEQPAESSAADIERGSEVTKPDPGFQRFTDGLVSAVFLWMFPHSVRPNHLTLVRFLLIPVVIVLLALGLDWWALAVFIIATCTDFIDGAMARRRDQITVLGTYIDPMADKLLVAAVLAWVAYEYTVILAWVMVAFIVVELIMMAVYMPILVRTRSARPANTFGKAKMVFQSIALYLFLLGGILGLETWMKIGWILLWPALALAVVSGTKQILGVWASTRPAAGPTEGGELGGRQGAGRSGGAGGPSASA